MRRRTLCGDTAEPNPLAGSVAPEAVLAKLIAKCRLLGRMLTGGFEARIIRSGPSGPRGYRRDLTQSDHYSRTMRPKADIQRSSGQAQLPEPTHECARRLSNHVSHRHSRSAGLGHQFAMRSEIEANGALRPAAASQHITSRLLLKAESFKVVHHDVT